MEEDNYIYCRRCFEPTFYTVANTIIFFFKDYRWYSCAQTICDRCQFQQSFFLYPELDWELRWAIKHDIGFIVIDGKPEAHQAIYDSFHDFFPDFLQERELSELEEKEILYLHWLIEHYDTRFFDERGQL